jgi:hypothetical protein
MGSAHGGGLGIIGSGRSTSSAETSQAREWKLDALADILDDVEISHAVVHVGGMTALDSVVYKLASRGFEPISLVRPTLSFLRRLSDVLYHYPAWGYEYCYSNGGAE